MDSIVKVNLSLKKFVSDISTNLFRDGDLIISVYLSGIKVEVKVVSWILKWRSSVFKKMIDSSMLESKSMRIDLGHYDGRVVLKMLEYIFKGELYDFTKAQPINYLDIYPFDNADARLIQQWFDLLNLCHMYDLEEYAHYLKRNIISQIDKETIDEIQLWANFYDGICQDIIEECLTYQNKLNMSKENGFEILSRKELRTELGKIKFKYHFSNELFEKSYEYDDHYYILDKLVQLSRKSLDNICIVPLSYEMRTAGWGQNHYFIYGVYLECDLLAVFDFLKYVNFHDFFFRLKIESKSEGPNTKICNKFMGRMHYDTSIDNIYGLKCCYDEKYGTYISSLDKDSDEYQFLTKKENGYYYHFWFVRKLYEDKQ